MKRKGKESKLNVVLTATLVIFVSLLCFSIGVISGKGWSDRNYKVRHIEQDSHLKMAQEDNAPIGDEITDREVELLTKKALEEAKAQEPTALIPQVQVAANGPGKDKKPTKEEAPQPLGREASTASNNIPMKKSVTKQNLPKRKISSLIPTKPTSIEYTVQVAAYKTIAEAERHSQKLLDKGFPAFPVKAMIKGEDWYRVSVSTFKTRKQAVKYAKDLKKQALVKNTFVRKIARLKK